MKIRYTLFSFFLPIFLFANNEIIEIHSQELNIKGVDFSFERIIDARELKGAIGSIQKGFKDERTLLMFKDGIESEFKKLFLRNCPDKEKATSLVFRINKFLVYEAVFMKKVFSIAEMNFTILQKKENKYIAIFESGNFQEWSGIDFTDYQSHTTNILKGITQFFQEFIEAKRNEQLLNIGVDEFALLESGLFYNDFPILKNKKIPKGVFHRFIDFREAHSDTTISFTLVKSDTKSKGKRVVWGNQKSINENIWGLSDGKDLYIRIEDLFFKLERKKKGFFIDVKVQDLKKKSFLLKKSIGDVNLKFASKEFKEAFANIGFALGFVVGIPHPFEKKDIVVVPLVANIKAGIIIYCPPAEEELPIRIFVDQVEQCTIQPNEYFGIYPEYHQQKMEVCLECAGKKRCRTVLTSLDYLIFLDANYHKRKGAELHDTTTEQSSLMIDGINKGSIISNCNNN